jgi:hypothetical protein
LTITFKRTEEDGSGRLQGSFDLKSYNTVAEENMGSFVGLILLNIALNLFDITFLLSGIYRRKKRRQDLLEANSDESQMKVIHEVVPLLKNIDVFDLVLRVAMSYNLVQFLIDKFYMPTKLSHLDQKTERILSIDWNSRSQSTAEKFNALFQEIASIERPLAAEESLRQFSFLMLLVLVIRAVWYLECHPRVSVLAGTLYNSFDDLFHFVILGGFIFVVSGFGASWMFGDNDEGFQSLTNALNRELEMLIGEFPWRNNPTSLYTFYFTFYILVVFITMLNFLLAVIVEQYEGMKDAIRECKIEKSFFIDVCYTFGYYRHTGRLARILGLSGWPARASLAHAPAAADVDGDQHFDRDDVSYPVSVATLEGLVDVNTDQKLFKDGKTVKDFIRWYAKLFPQIRYQWLETREPVLAHQQRQKRWYKLTAALNENLGPAELALTDDERNARHRQSALEEILESLDSRLSSVETGEKKLASKDAPTANGDSSVSLEAALKAVSAALESEHGGTDAAQGFTMEEALLLEKVGKSLAERESRQAREKAANGVPKLNEIPSPRPSEERRAQVDLPGML